MPFPHSESLEILGEPLRVGDKVLPNRLCCQAMEGCDGTRDGAPDTLTERRYLRFARGGAFCTLVVAEVCEHKGRFLDGIINGLMAISEETYRGVSAHYLREVRMIPDALHPSLTSLPPKPPPISPFACTCWRTSLPPSHPRLSCG